LTLEDVEVGFGWTRLHAHGQTFFAVTGMLNDALAQVGKRRVVELVFINHGLHLGCKKGAKMAVEQVEKWKIRANALLLVFLRQPMVGVLCMGFKLKRPYKQRCRYLHIAHLSEQQRITDAEVFGAEDFFAVARLEIKMVEPGASVVAGSDMQLKRFVFEQGSYAFYGEIIVVEGIQIDVIFHRRKCFQPTLYSAAESIVEVVLGFGRERMIGLKHTNVVSLAQ